MQQKVELMHHTGSVLTIFLVKQFLDLLSKDYFLPHAVDIVIICQVKRIILLTLTNKVGDEATRGKRPL